MQETRRARLAAVIQQELSVVIPREVKDPRVPTITITNVEVTPDGGQATVYVNILGSHGTLSNEKAARKEMQECLVGLNSAAGFLRRHIAGVLTIRHIPTLIFREDKGLANANRVYDLLKQISKDDQATTNDQAEGQETGDTQADADEPSRHSKSKP